MFSATPAAVAPEPGSPSAKPASPGKGRKRADDGKKAAPVPHAVQKKAIRNGLRVQIQG
jgi:hypothetical protein